MNSGQTSKKQSLNFDTTGFAHRCYYAIYRAPYSRYYLNNIGISLNMPKITSLRAQRSFSIENCSLTLRTTIFSLLFYGDLFTFQKEKVKRIICIHYRYTKSMIFVVKMQLKLCCVFASHMKRTCFVHRDSSNSENIERNI